MIIQTLGITIDIGEEKNFKKKLSNKIKEIDKQLLEEIEMEEKENVEAA